MAHGRQVACDGRPRHFSNVVSSQVVRFVAHERGDDGVAQLLASADELPALEVLLDPSEWITYDELHALLRAVHDLFGSIDAVRRAGEHFDVADQAGVFQALGSPAEVIRLITDTCGRYGTALDMWTVGVSDDHGVVGGRSVPGFPRTELLCALTAGILTHGPRLFGLEPVVVEERCEQRGDPSCWFRVGWHESDAAQQRIHRLEVELAQARRGIKNLQSTVRDLVSGAEVDEVLARVTHRATRAVTAPQYVLAVRLGGEEARRVHQIGIAERDLEVLVDELLDEEPDDVGGSRLVVDVRSGDHHYGRLAALHPAGTRFLPDDRAVFAAYAELAAAALDSATALAEARRQAARARREDAVAQSLLELSRALARVSVASDVAQRLAEAVPSTVGCDAAVVLLADPTSSRPTLRAVGHHNVAARIRRLLDGLLITSADTPYVDRLFDDGEPIFVRLDGEDRFVQGMLEMTGTRSAVIAPIGGSDRVYGAVVAASFGGLAPDEHLLARLAGIAGHGATALQNAELLEAVRHQALHDPLTDTPNQRLFEDHVELALSRARRDATRVGLLFVDLDRFKAVNDTLGHAVGDLLLREVAARLEASVRAADTVSRLGGDEFAVVLPDLRDGDVARRVAERIVEALDVPFEVDGHRLSVTASVGLALSPDDGEGYTELLRSADAAMYIAKSTGRGCLHVSRSG